MSDEHVTGLPVYLAVFAALMVLTGVTVWAAYYDFGPLLHDLIAMAIATAKGTIVILYFMHVRHSSRLSKITVVSGFVWLVLLIGFTLTDYFTRGFLNP